MSTAAAVPTGSKSTIKQKDRPKSNSQTNVVKKSKKEDEVIDQLSSSASLSVDKNLLESLDCPKRCIADEEIYALKITEEELLRIREPCKLRTPLPAKSVVVQRVKQSPYPPDARLQRVTVACPVPDDSQLHPRDFSAAAGARLDCNGNIIPHSILGDLDEFICEAKCRQDLPCDFDQKVLPPRSESQLSIKYAKKKESSSGYTSKYYGGLAEDKALKNWETRMAERRCQQQYLSTLLGKPAEALAMNQGDGIRKVNELRHLIDRTMPYVDRGKGYRAGSEFWSQQANIGGDECGLFVTLTRTERGCPLPIEHSGVPHCTLYQKGLMFESNSGAGTQTIHKPWHQSEYLRRRVTRLAPLMDEIDPYVPETSELEVVGQPIVICSACGQACVKSCHCQSYQTADEGNTAQSHHGDDLSGRSGDCIEDLEKNHTEHVYGPSVVFAGQSLKWAGSDVLSHSQVAASETRVSFETGPCERRSASIEVMNDGTTAIYYKWKKLCKYNPFDRADDRIQRFYFDPVGGVLLPGECVKFSFIYRSPTPGIFNEHWQFSTHPVVCSGAPIMVVLHGVTTGRDEYCNERLILERLLLKREANQIARSILDGVIDRVYPICRPRSPPNAYLTEEEIFNQRNPKLEYMEESCSRLGMLYMETVPEELMNSSAWDLRPTSIHRDIMVYCTDEIIRDEFLERLNDAVLPVSYRHIRPDQNLLYNVGYQMLGSMVDKMFDESERLKRQLTSNFVMPSDIKQTDGPVTSAPEGSLAEDTQSSTLSQEGSVGSKRGKGKKEPVRRPKEPKANKNPGKSSKMLASSAESSEPAAAAAGAAPHDQPVAAAAGLSEEAKEKYLDRFYAEVYSLLCETVEDMEAAFADLLDRKPDGWPNCEDNNQCSCLM